MDIEASRRRELISQIESQFHCIEECGLTLAGFDEHLRADVVAISKLSSEPWILAFEIKEPNQKWELKNWLKAIKQAADYPNCKLTDERAGSVARRIINASFLYPGPNLSPWIGSDTQRNRFYREYDLEPLRGAILLAQHFRVGWVNNEPKANKFSLKIGTDPVWDSKLGFRKKSAGLLIKRRIGSSKRAI